MGNTSTILLIFPGQGAQYRGMGSDLFAKYDAARRTYEEASDVLGYDIAELSFSDPDTKINLTRHTQPALLTHSVACLRVFKEQIGIRYSSHAAAGHSLGEYSALVAADSLDFSAALELVQRRGELMGILGQGEMEALPISREAAQRLAAKHYCGVAACNLPDQTVIGGLPEDLDRLVSEFKELDTRNHSTRLKTEGAFHTYLMVEAATNFRPMLETAEFREPQIPVLSNYTGTFYESDTNAIRAGLFLQLFYPVLWHDNLQEAVADGVDTIIEFGGGIGKGELPDEKKPNLAGIVKRAFRRTKNPLNYHAIVNYQTLQDSVRAFSE